MFRKVGQERAACQVARRLALPLPSLLTGEAIPSRLQLWGIMLTELVLFLLVGCVGFALLTLALGVTLTYASQRLLLEPEVFPVDFAVDPEIPRDQLQKATTKLIQNGLSPAGDYGIRLMPKAHVCSRLFTDEQGTMMGHLSMVKASRP